MDRFLYNFLKFLIYAFMCIFSVPLIIVSVGTFITLIVIISVCLISFIPICLLFLCLDWIDDRFT